MFADICRNVLFKAPEQLDRLIVLHTCNAYAGFVLCFHYARGSDIWPLVNDSNWSIQTVTSELVPVCI